MNISIHEMYITQMILVNIHLATFRVITTTKYNTGGLVTVVFFYEKGLVIAVFSKAQPMVSL